MERSTTILVSSFVMVNFCKPIFMRMQSLIDNVNLKTRELLSGLYVSRAFNRADYDIDKSHKANESLYKNQLFLGRIMAFIAPLLGLGASGISVLVLLIGGYYISFGSLQVGDLVAFISYSTMVITAFTSLGLFLGSIPRATVAVNRIEEIIKTDTKIKYDNSDKKKMQVKDIVFKDVSFSYTNSKTCAVENLNFSISPNTTTGIIGTTGSGKSTIIKLILRFQDPSGGKIIFGDKDIKDLDIQNYRSLFAYAPQQSFLFSGTVKSNVGYGKHTDDKNSDSDYLLEKLNNAQAGDFIKNSEDLDREISQDSTNISGGQRQRLSIARALATDAEILLLDDCFTALDYKVESKLRKTLKNTKDKNTKIIVSSRISSIIDADQIIVLENGKIAGIGTHDTLMSTCGEYIKIAKSQLETSIYKDGGEQNED